MSMGRGSIYSSSSKQKLTTRSSTECEVVGVYDQLPQMIWTDLFLKAQGLSLGTTVLYQDNMSAMLLEKNGRMSSTKRTKHMNVRYFYITDLVKQEAVSIQHCPTERMIADFFTKPLQGRLFQQLRDYVMGATSHDDTIVDTNSIDNANCNDGRVPTQECLEDRVVKTSYADVIKNGMKARLKANLWPGAALEEACVQGPH